MENDEGDEGDEDYFDEEGDEDSRGGGGGSNMTGVSTSMLSTETWVGSIMSEVGIMTSRMNSMLLCQ